MPTRLPIATRSAVNRSLAGYSEALGEDFVSQALQTVQDGINSILNPQQVDGVTTGATPTTIRANVADLLKRFADPAAVAEELKLDFKIDVATRVARGAGRKVAQSQPVAVEEYPALELTRLYDRDVPRGQKLEKGVLVDVPEDAWEARWQAAANESGDTDAARLLSETGRMVALKASPIWQSLGNGAGGYDDTLGNDYPPFAFNSGYGVEEISRADCEQLGLLQPGATAPQPELDLTNLFGMEVAA